MSDFIYVAGRPQQIDGVDVQPGDRIDETKIPHLESFISAGYVYRLADEADIDRLPPHMFAILNEHRTALFEFPEAEPVKTVRLRKSKKQGESAEETPADEAEEQQEEPAEEQQKPEETPAEEQGEPAAEETSEPTEEPVAEKPVAEEQPAEPEPEQPAES